ncbi:MAG: TonB-dependent receptor [Vicingaceae bacterium]|nr:TonB-dependent receptor [Vicingaceae bacterium]
MKTTKRINLEILSNEFIKKIALLSFSILIICSAMLAQNGEIKGVIKDKATGEPIFNVSVYVEIGGSLKGAVTDFDGKYTIKPLSTGTYKVIAKSTGFGTIETKEVRITSDKITYVDMVMEQTATMLNPFIITEVLHKIPLISKDEPHVLTLTPDEMKHSPNQRDPIKIATSLPGVTLANNGKDVYIRGARPTSTQFITDGMKSITGEIGIPGQAIGAMKVYTGGIPAKYGDVSGGIIIVETKSYFDLAQQFK